MRKVIILLQLILLMIVSMSNVWAFSINPIHCGSQIAADDVAEGAFVNGGWYINDFFDVSSDAGFYGPAFAVYDLSHVSDPIASAMLSFEIAYVSTPYDANVPLALYDISDINGLIEKPDWTSMADYMDDFWEMKADMTSGTIYGECLLSNMGSVLSIDVFLNESAISDINDSLGGLFAIGFAPGEISSTAFFPDEGAGVCFQSARLDLNPVPEPTSLLLLGIGAAGIAFLRRNKIGLYFKV